MRTLTKRGLWRKDIGGIIDGRGEIMGFIFGCAELEPLRQ